MDLNVTRRLPPVDVQAQALSIGDVESDADEAREERITLQLSGACRLERPGTGAGFATKEAPKS